MKSHKATERLRKSRYTIYKENNCAHLKYVKSLIYVGTTSKKFRQIMITGLLPNIFSPIFVGYDFLAIIIPFSFTLIEMIQTYLNVLVCFCRMPWYLTNSHYLTQTMSRSSRRNRKRSTMVHGVVTSALWTAPIAMRQVPSARLPHRLASFSMDEVHQRQLFRMVRISTSVLSYPQV